MHPYETLRLLETYKQQIKDCQLATDNVIDHLELIKIQINGDMDKLEADIDRMLKEVS